MDKKKLLALLIFLIMGFFMVSFANPSDQLTPVDTGAQESTDNNANQTNVNPTRTTTTDTRTNQTVATNATPVQTNDTTTVVDDSTPEVGNVDIQEFTVRFVDYANNLLKSQTVEEHTSASASDITVEDYTLANITYSFSKWDRDFSDVTSNMTVKALYDVKKIIAHVYINGELVDGTVEIKVNDDTKDKKDIELTDNNIDDYIVDTNELPEAKPGKENEVEKLTFDEEEGYIVEINENDIDYTITGTNGALVNGKEETIAHMGDEVTLSHVEKEGYDFEYYMVQDGDTIYIVEGTEITVNTDDVIVTAVYSKITYKIEYVLNGGSVEGNPTEYNVESDDITLNNPTKEGYTFDGWTIGNSRPSKNVVIKTGSTGDRVYTAHFTARNDIKYVVETYEEKLTYTSDEDKYEKTDSKEFFNGTADKEKEIKADAITGFTTPASQTVTIAANGSTVVEFYYDRVQRTVTFNIDKEEYSKETLRYGETITVPSYTVAAGYTFSGWTNVATTMGTTNLVYNATTTPINYTITYVLPNKATNASTNPTQYNITQTPITLSDASMSGYTFNGWTDEDGKTSIEANSYGNKTFTGSFTAKEDNTYIVRVFEKSLNGQYVENTSRRITVDNAKTDDELTINAPEASEGFKLNDETSKSLKVSATEDNIVDFKYDRETYKVTYYVDNEFYAEQSYLYGQTIVKPTYTVAAGYTFSGWTNVASTMPAQNLKYYATTTAKEDNTYIVRVMEKNLNGVYVENTSRRITVDNAKTDDELTINAPEASDGFKLNDETSKSLKVSATEDNIVDFKYDRETYKATYTINNGYYTEQSYLYGQTIVKPAYTVAAGYTFSGWTVDATMPAENKTYDATLTANENNTYIVRVMEKNLNDVYVENTSRRITVNNAKTDDELTINAPEASDGFKLNDESSKSLKVSATEDNIVEFKYDRETYKVTYYVDNEFYAEQSYLYGQTIVKPTYTVAAGYTFSGWTNVASTMPAQNLEYYATTTAKEDNTYIVKVMEETLEGGYAENTSRRITVNNAKTDATLSIAAPDASEGFELNDEETTPKSLKISATTENVVEFKYDRKTVSVTFNYHEGSEIKTTKFGGSVVPPTIAQTYNEDGYTFTFKSWDGTYTNVTKAEIVTATYNKVATEYGLSYVLNGGQLAQGKTNPSKYTVEQLPLTINSPSKTGYDFTNWTDQDGNTITNSLAVGTTGAKTLTAHYSAKEYTITYVLNGGQLAEGQSNPTKYTIETNTITLNNPAKDGYEFDGWYETVNGREVKVTEITKGTTGNKTLTAKYTPVSYKITYNLDGGNATNPTSYTIETNTFKLNNPTKANFDFAGWTGSNGTTPQKEVSITKGSTGDKNYTATWERKASNLTVNTTITGNKPAEYGDTLTITVTVTNGANSGESGAITLSDSLLKNSFANFEVVSAKHGNTSINGTSLINNGYTIDNIAAGESATITLTIKVIGNAGSKIETQFKADPTYGDTKTAAKQTVNIETTVKFVKKTEKVVGTNIILLIDESGSMGYNTDNEYCDYWYRKGYMTLLNDYCQSDKFINAKQAAKNFLDTVFSSANSTGNVVVSAYRFGSDNSGDYAKQIGSDATNATTKEALKNAIGALNDHPYDSATPYNKAFEKAYSELYGTNGLSSNGNKNVVIFLTDGAPDSGKEGTTQLANLYSKSTIIYSIGYGINSNSSAFTRLKNISENSGDADHRGKAFTSATGLSDLNAVFNAINSDIKDHKTSVLTSIGVAEIGSDIIANKPITINVTDKNGNAKPALTYNNLEAALNSGYIIKVGNVYDIDAKKFNAGDKIEVTFFGNGE